MFHSQCSFYYQIQHIPSDCEELSSQFTLKFFSAQPLSTSIFLFVVMKESYSLSVVPSCHSLPFQDKELTGQHMSGTRKFYLIVIYCITFSEIHLSSYVAFYGTPKAGNMLKSVRMSCFFQGVIFHSFY